MLETRYLLPAVNVTENETVEVPRPGDRRKNVGLA
jgi:hypothetical protein